MSFMILPFAMHHLKSLMYVQVGYNLTNHMIAQGFPTPLPTPLSTIKPHNVEITFIWGYASLHCSSIQSLCSFAHPCHNYLWRSERRGFFFLTTYSHPWHLNVFFYVSGEVVMFETSRRTLHCGTPLLCLHQLCQVMIISLTKNVWTPCRNPTTSM